MILGLQYGWDPCSLAIVHEGMLVYEWSLTNSHILTESITDSVREGCQRVGKTFHDLRAIGVLQGTGSYTGIRVSVSVAKTFSQVLAIPIYGFSTLEVMLFPYREIDGLYVSMVPARGEDWVAGVFAMRQGRCVRMTPDFLWKEAVLVQKLQSFQEPITVVGLFLERLKQIRGVKGRVLGSSIALMAQDRWAQGDVGLWRQVQPCYSHPPTIGKAKGCQ